MSTRKRATAAPTQASKRTTSDAASASESQTVELLPQSSENNIPKAVIVGVQDGQEGGRGSGGKRLYDQLVDFTDKIEALPKGLTSSTEQYDPDEELAILRQYEVLKAAITARIHAKRPKISNSESETSSAGPVQEQQALPTQGPLTSLNYTQGDREESTSLSSEPQTKQTVSLDGSPPAIVAVPAIQSTPPRKPVSSAISDFISPGFNTPSPLPSKEHWFKSPPVPPPSTSLAARKKQDHSPTPSPRLLSETALLGLSNEQYISRQSPQNPATKAEADRVKSKAKGNKERLKQLENQDDEFAFLQDDMLPDALDFEEDNKQERSRQTKVVVSESESESTSIFVGTAISTAKNTATTSTSGLKSASRTSTTSTQRFHRSTVSTLSSVLAMKTSPSSSLESSFTEHLADAPALAPAPHRTAPGTSTPSLNSKAKASDNSKVSFVDMPLDPTDQDVDWKVEATRHGHSSSKDPLSKLNIIRDRPASAALPFKDREDVVRLTRSCRLVPLWNSDMIREAGLRYENHLGPGRASNAVLPPRPAKGVTARDKEEDKQKNWILAGVIGAMSKMRRAKNGSSYAHFQLSDLEDHVVNVFMFRSVFQEYFGKLELGQIVVILNPKVLKLSDNNYTISTQGVELDNADNLLVLGTCPDLGFCQAIKMDDTDCNKPQNKSVSPYCRQHILLATNRMKSKSSALYAGTSSIYDLGLAGPKMGLPGSKPGGAKDPRGQSLWVSGQAPQQTTRLLSANVAGSQGSADTTSYIFDDGTIASSSLTETFDPKPKARKTKQQHGDVMTKILMNQDDPGAMYIRQARSSKEVVWASEVLRSPTRPRNIDSYSGNVPGSPSSQSPHRAGTPSVSYSPGGTELFPMDVVKKMGFDPVTGMFVPGSPQRVKDDPMERMRSIQLLTERTNSRTFTKTLSPIFKSPPRASITTTGAGSEGRTTPTKNTSAKSTISLPFSPRSRLTMGSRQLTWVDLDDSEDEDGEGEGLKELWKAAAANSGKNKQVSTTPTKQSSSVAATVTAAGSSIASRPIAVPRRPKTGPAAGMPMMPPQPNAKQQTSNESRSDSKPTSVQAPTTAITGVDTMPTPAAKKFVSLDDSESE